MKRAKRVSEAVPVQVYLARDERGRLERLAASLGTTKADVLRRGLLALEREVEDPAQHPLLRLAGIGQDRGEDLSYDPAVEHDRAIADAEIARWNREWAEDHEGAPLGQPAPPARSAGVGQAKKRGRRARR